MSDERYPSKEIILNLLKTGMILTTAFLAPGAVRIFAGNKDYSKWRKFHRPLLVRNIKNLRRKGLVEFIQKGDDTVVKITRKGNTEILKYDIENMSIKRPDKWDQRWRLVLFDIPNDKKNEREIFRKKLKQLGFYQFQESVFIFPFPCFKEIKYIREILNVPDEVKLLKAEAIENSEELEIMYGLD